MNPVVHFEMPYDDRAWPAQYPSVVIAEQDIAGTGRSPRHPHAPVYPQSVQKSHPSLRIIARLPHSGHFLPGSVL